MFEQSLIHQKEDDTMEYIHPIENLSCKRLTIMIMDLGGWETSDGSNLVVVVYAWALQTKGKIEQRWFEPSYGKK